MTVLESSRTYFELLQPIGEGLNSQVYSAIRKDASKTIHQKVAVKILKSRNSVDFWRQEIESLIRVDSIYCVKVLEFQWLNDFPALVLEWVDGLTLDQLHKHHVLSKSDVHEIAAQIQAGLKDLECRTLCHGDLNPGNIMITSDGQIKLLDFGLANLTRHRCQGTPAFMAPEVHAGEIPTPHSDLFSLGALMEYLAHPAPQLKSETPSQRQPLTVQSTRKQRQHLGRLVQDIQSKQCRLHEIKTRELPPSTPSLRWTTRRALTVMAIAFSLTSAAESFRRFEPTCELQIRTQKWVQVRIQAETAQYAPISYKNLKCQPLKLSWTSGEERGQMEIPLRPGETKVLSDADLGL